MKSKKILLITLLLLTVFTISAVSAADNLTDEGVLQDTSLEEIELDDDSGVDTFDKTDADENLSTYVSVEGNTFTDIQEAINHADWGYTIKLNGTYMNDNANEYGLSVNRYKLILDGGDNTILDGRNSSNIQVLGASVVIKNIKFVNFKTNGNGGAIYITNRNCTIENCQFINCTSNDMGGAIYFDYGDVRITKSVFENCSSKVGGAIYIAENTSGIAEDCNFKRCSALEGAIINYGLHASFDVYNCLAEDSHSPLIASPTISQDSEEKMAETDDGTFTALQNKIDNASSGATISLENDYAHDKDFKNGEWGIEISKSLTINGNGHAIYGNSTRIFYVHGSVHDKINLVLDNITFINGKDAIYSFANSLTVKNCVFTDNNKAIDSGGNGLTVESCIFNSNTAPVYGVVYSYQQNTNISDSEFNNNVGIAVYMVTYDVRITSPINSELSSMTVKNCNFTSNSEGAISCNYIHNKALAVNCIFIDNDVLGTVANNYIFKKTSNTPSVTPTTTTKTTKKLTPKLTAKKATFKVKTKTKKYKATLKTNKNKAMKKIKIYLKVKGKTYTAKTNNKGKATFNIKNLKKKGTYKATITFKGNKNFKKVTKTIKIIVK